MELVAFLGTDKETWGQVTGLINRGEWEKIILVQAKSSPDFTSTKKTDLIKIDTTKPLIEIKETLLKELKGKFSGFDVNLSIASGTGKEHMALISALLTVPVGIRLVVFTKKGIEFIS
jgi:hypothetical protein